MTVRLIAASLTTLALVVGFTLGRVTGPHDVATAQTAPLSHFMCYQTKLSTAAVAGATVGDQFGTTDRKLYRADMFCAPAKKKPFFKPLGVPGNADHLTCYHTDGAFINAARKIFDQLEATQFNGLTPRYFCMPTFKQG